VRIEAAPNPRKYLYLFYKKMSGAIVASGERSTVQSQCIFMHSLVLPDKVSLAKFILIYSIDLVFYIYQPKTKPLVPY
jgi:hypothetical protein